MSLQRPAFCSFGIAETIPETSMMESRMRLTIRKNMTMRGDMATRQSITTKLE